MFPLFFLGKIMITIFLTAALICFNSHCSPILIGHTTPIGKYALHHELTDEKGYGGDILAFAETEDHTVLAIHRIYTLGKNNHRLEQIQESSIHRRYVTHGCINVMPEVYQQLINCCSNDIVTIEP